MTKKKPKVERRPPEVREPVAVGATVPIQRLRAGDMFRCRCGLGGTVVQTVRKGAGNIPAVVDNWDLKNACRHFPPDQIVTYEGRSPSYAHVDLDKP